MSAKAKPYLDAIAPYVAGKSETGLHDHDQPVIKLSSNENPYGPSPKALEAFQNANTNLHRYAEGSGRLLRETIEQVHGLPADQIICGAGSDEILGLLVHAFAGPGDEVLFTEHAFLMYKIYTMAHGATPLEVPEKDVCADIDAILDGVTEKTKLVFLANPNNPTGSYISKYQLHQLRHELRDDIVLVIDGAYSEYMTADDYSAGHELVGISNTVVTHTFSKVYGLPALRMGWGFGPKGVIDTLHKIRSPFNVTGPAIAAASAALKDIAYTEECVGKNNLARTELTETITALGLKVHPSFANFILIRFDQDGKKTSSAANHFLLERGIIVRDVSNYKLPDCLRISIGTDAENKTLIGALTEFCA